MDNLLDDQFFGDDFSGIRNRTIIEMLYMTGMRRAELIGLRNSDVDLSEGSVKVTGKRNKQRIIPLVKPFIKQLEQYIKLRDEKSLKIQKEDGFLLLIRETSCMINMFIL